MQFSSAILTLFAASGAMALPQAPAPAGSETTVLLKGNNVAAWLAKGFSENQKSQVTDPQLRVFETAQLTLGKNVQNKDLRCQLLDANGARIVVTRNTNIDFTLGDQDKGPWTLKKPTAVQTVVCDPKFTKINPDDVNVVRVVLSDGAETGAQLQFSSTEVKGQATKNPATDGPFTEVTLEVGPNIDNQALRCKLLDNHGAAIPLQRGSNKDTTFGDAGKGAWTFQKGSTKVEKVVCSPSFVKAAA